MSIAPSTVTLEALADRLEKLDKREQEHACQVADLEAANTALREEVVRQQERMARYEAEIVRWQADRPTEPEAMDPPELIVPASVRRGPDGPRAEPDQSPSRRRTSRRKLLQLGGAAAATVAAGVLAAEGGSTAQAASARADSVTFQQSASGSGNVAIEGDGTSGALGVVGTSDSSIAVEGNSTSGFGVYGTTSSGYGVWGNSNSSTGVQGASTSGTGVVGESTSGVGVFARSTTFDAIQAYGGGGFKSGVYAVGGSGYGVYATSTDKVAAVGISTNSVGVWGEADAPSGVGGVFIGGRAPLSLGQGAGPGAPASGGHFIGDIYLDSLAVVWVCIATGTPGTWVRLTSVASGTSGGALTFVSTPIRLLDTRPGYAAATAPGAKISAGSTFDLSVAGVTYGGVTIPTTAKALVGNCTVVNPAGVGDLAAYPDLLPLPNTAVMHYLAGQIVSNGITIGLGTNGKLAITALGSATDVIIDCQGIIM